MIAGEASCYSAALAPARPAPVDVDMGLGFRPVAVMQSCSASFTLSPDHSPRAPSPRPPVA
eukprot:3688858-Alexandrium_andersonii.AAC.1